MSKAITFDTLEYTEQLKAAGVPEEQAKGHAKALALVIKQVDTRTDEQASRSDRQAENRFATLAEKNEKQIQSRLDGLATKQEMEYRLAALEANLKRDVDLTKAELRKEIEVAKNETIRWMVGLALAQLAMMAGILMTLVRVLPGGH
ncbi:MAG: CCDC90 family protein [Magnetococcus sp. YQC-3]